VFIQDDRIGAHLSACVCGNLAELAKVYEHESSNEPKNGRAHEKSLSLHDHSWYRRNLGAKLNTLSLVFFLIHEKECAHWEQNLYQISSAEYT
jgi:hypothetical protein